MAVNVCGRKIDFSVIGENDMNNPFRSKEWQRSIKQENRLYPSEFCMSMTEPNGIFVKLEEINQMILEGVLTVDFEKLEQRIYDRTVIKVD